MAEWQIGEWIDNVHLVYPFTGFPAVAGKPARERLLIFIIKFASDYKR